MPVPTYHQGKTVIDCVERVVHIWEMPSEDRAFHLLSYHAGHYSADVLVFDVTDRESFDDIHLHMSVVEQCRFTATEEKQWVVLIGTKYGLMNERVVSTDKLEEFARTHGAEELALWENPQNREDTSCLRS